MFSESRFWSFSLLTDVLCSLLYNIWYHKMPPYLIKIFLSLRHKMKLKNVPAFPKYILKITHKSETWRKKRRKEKKREKEKEKEKEREREKEKEKEKKKKKKKEIFQKKKYTNRTEDALPPKMMEAKLVWVGRREVFRLVMCRHLWVCIKTQQKPVYMTYKIQGHSQLSLSFYLLAFPTVMSCSLKLLDM